MTQGAYLTVFFDLGVESDSAGGVGHRVLT